VREAAGSKGHAPCQNDALRQGEHGGVPHLAKSAAALSHRLEGRASARPRPATSSRWRPRGSTVLHSHAWECSDSHHRDDRPRRRPIPAARRWRSAARRLL